MPATETKLTWGSRKNSLLNTLKPENLFERLDAWVWSPKVTVQNNYGDTRRLRKVRPPGFKQGSRFVLVFLLGFGMLTGTIGGLFWIGEHRPHYFVAVIAVPIIIWILYTLKPVKYAE